MFCQSCGTQLNDNVRFCSCCGTPSAAQQQCQQPLKAGGMGYSPVANTPEFRQLAAMKKNEETRFFKRILIFICVFAGLPVIGVLIFADATALKAIVTAVVAGIAIPVSLVILNRINRRKKPPFEAIVRKHHTTQPDLGGIESNPCSWNYLVIFKNGAGRSIHTDNAHDERFQEYYQIDDRCLYHADIDFFEKYDKSRDTFSLCPFCKEKVEIGQTRCTRCRKPMLV